MKVKIVNKRATVDISSSRSLPSDEDVDTVIPDSEEYEEDEDNEDEGDDDVDQYDEDGSPVHTRRSSRLAPRTSKTELPFSPRKTRSQAIHVVDSDEEDENEERSLAPTRRSTRSKKVLKVKLDESTYLDSDQDDEDSDNYSRAKGKQKPKKKRIRGAASRPALGRFRAVSELDYDSHTDEETAPLREHREICEKCHRAPAHVLLEAERKKPKGKGRRKKKTSDDEFEESGDEIDKLTALGGWVRWYVSSHRFTTQTDDNFQHVA